MATWQWWLDAEIGVHRIGEYDEYEKRNNGLEVPDPALDFYSAKDVPHGEVRIRWYHSQVTGTMRRAFVYTPPDYDRKPNEHYPALYLQHGAGESERAWTFQGQFHTG